jgi:N4-gp56 family major capsid protein
MFQPAINTTQSAGLSSVTTQVFYKKTGLDRLMQTFRFYSAGDTDDIPKRSGRTVQWFRFNLLGSNTTPSAEGVVGLPIPLGSNNFQATVEQFSDFTNLSTMLIDTAINDMVAQASEDMSYRAALSVDLTVRTEIESNPSAIRQTQGAYFSAADINASITFLKAANVQPRDDGGWMMILHPYMTYDLLSDNSAGGFVEVMKYADPNRFIAGEIGRWMNTRIVETTNVAVVAGTGAQGANAKYHGYLFGKGGLGVVALAGRGPNNVTDPRKSTFNVSVIRGEKSIYDPEGQIGAAVSYYYVFTAKTMDTVVPRFAIVEADVSLV